MPIRAEIRKYYGADWQAYRLVLIELLGTRCTECGRDVPRYFNFAHLDHNPRNRSRIAGMCPACHSRNDSPQRYAMTRRTRARRNRQLWLTVELEFAPYPDSFWPKRVVRDLQGELFG
jgi:5-methylcytosine-specific restriction endonuclease McrA